MFGRAILVRLLPHALVGALVAGTLAGLWWHAPTGIWTIAGSAGAAAVVAWRRARVAVSLVAVAIMLGLAGWGWGTVRVVRSAPVVLDLPAAALGTVDVDTAPQAVRGGVRVRLHAVDLRVAGQAVRPGTRFFADFAEPTVALGPGRRLRVTARALDAAGATAPGWWRAYLKRNLIAGRLRMARVEAAGVRAGVFGLRDRLRFAAGRAAGAGLTGEPRAIVRGLALGGGAGLSEATAQAFRDAGIWHLLAVSGQNVAVIARAVLTLVLAFGLSRRRAAGLSLVTISVYCLACDGGASVARAGVMGALVVLAELCSRAADRWYLVLIGLAALVVVQPRAIGDPGLQLSFAAIVGMFTVADPITRRLAAVLPRSLASLLAQSLGATLATAPVIVWHFGAISLVGLVANLLAVPIAAPIVVAALVGIGTGWVFPAAGVLVNLVAGAGGVILIAVARTAARVPGATVALPVWSTPIVALPVLLAVWWVRRSDALRPVAPLPRIGVRPVIAVAAVVTVVFAIALPGQRGARVWPAVAALTVLDVGQGDALLLRSPDGAAVLVDTGPAGPPAPVVGALRNAGVRRLSRLILTHDQADHAGAAATVLDRFAVDAVAMAAPVPSAEAAARHERVAVERLAAGDRFAVGVWEVEVLSPREAQLPPGDPNEASLVMLARAPGITALLTADAESGVLSRVVKGPVDVLKVSHHGSADPGLATLLRRLHPAVALISVGRGNRYGHPDPGTVGSLTAAGVMVRRTDQGGETTVSATPGGIALTASR